MFAAVLGGRYRGDQENVRSQLDTKVTEQRILELPGAL